MPSQPSPFTVLGKFWQNAGLSWLLADSPERKQILTGKGPQAQDPRPASKNAAPPIPQTAEAAGSPLYSAPKADFPPLPVLKRADWPDDWQALLERRKMPERPKTVWTYAGLEQDLLGQPDPLRQQLVGRLIRDLNHPGGTHVFWPYRLPEQGMQPESMFWSWEAVFRPRALLIFGEEAATALSLPQDFNLYASHDYQGRQVVFLPDPGKLAEDQAMYASVLALLARLLSFCKR